MNSSAFTRGIVTGMMGGLAGTISMYLFGVAIFLLLGWPANTSFMIIGDSAAAFSSKLGVVLPGVFPLGIRLYFLIGLIFGAVFGVSIQSLAPLRQASPQKKVGVSILYVEALSLPLLAAGTLALEMDVASAVQWFTISFVMHLIYGLVLGTVMNYLQVGLAWPRLA